MTAGKARPFCRNRSGRFIASQVGFRVSRLSSRAWFRHSRMRIQGLGFRGWGLKSFGSTAPKNPTDEESAGADGHKLRFSRHCRSKHSSSRQRHNHPAGFRTLSGTLCIGGLGLRISAPRRKPLHLKISWLRLDVTGVHVGCQRSGVHGGRNSALAR